MKGPQSFDNEKYISLQSERIRERISKFGGKLYLEFGGKIFDDNHAARVLPGFCPDSKIRMLDSMKDHVEVVLVISAFDIEKNRTRSDIGITYGMDVLRLTDSFRERGFFVGSVVITHYSGQPSADALCSILKASGMRYYKHYMIAGYPSNIPAVVSDDGFGKNDYVETERPLVVVTAPGPGSGKMAVCLSQLYNDNKRGIKSGYAKFETFPVWNLPLKHPVNLAYEAATADLNDLNMIDPFHLEAYGETAVSYNRDTEIFPVLQAMFEHIFGESPYRSPTDMGVNMTGKCISDESAVIEAAKAEIVRRYFWTLCDVKKGIVSEESAIKLELLLKQAGTRPEDRKVVNAVREHPEMGIKPISAIELPNGKVVTGKESSMMVASSAMMLNAVKELADIEDNVHLLSPYVLEPVQKLKVNYLREDSPILHLDETLISLSVCAITNPMAEKVLQQLPKLRGCEFHSSVILESRDESILRSLGVNMTSEPKFRTKSLYQEGY
ncbi:MAG: DUF1846 domain-containing protein [Thermoplasmatales archaeon]|jgi:uncharacterized protein (UPF0371 family)|nr:DUF1846 domain-containing protein [Thermoplasmatales archaeon]